MANVDDAYCALEDLRTGDIATPSYTSKEQYIKNAAEEIDAALGHVYKTPFEIDSTPENRPTILVLKKLNWLLASGRMMLDVAAAGEDVNLHAYGKRLLDEAFMMIAELKTGDPLLPGADTIDAEASTDPTGPMIHNEDSQSLVESFYLQRQDPFYGTFLGAAPQAVPYVK